MNAVEFAIRQQKLESTTNMLIKTSLETGRLNIRPSEVNRDPLSGSSATLAQGATVVEYTCDQQRENTRGSGVDGRQKGGEVAGGDGGYTTQQRRNGHFVCDLLLETSVKK